MLFKQYLSYEYKNELKIKVLNTNENLIKMIINIILIIMVILILK
jgi:hypothetical protein